MPEPITASTDLAYKPKDCSAGQKWNWCVKACVPADSKMADCPPTPIPPIHPGQPPPPHQCIPGHPNCPPIPGGGGGCPPGHIMDPHTHRCAAPGGPGIPNCPRGQHYSTTSHRCTPDQPFFPRPHVPPGRDPYPHYPTPPRRYGYKYRCPMPPYHYPCPYPPHHFPRSYFPYGYPVLISGDWLPITTVVGVPYPVGGDTTIINEGDTTTEAPVEETPAPAPVEAAPSGGLGGLLGGNSTMLLLGLGVLVVLIMMMKK